MKLESRFIFMYKLKDFFKKFFLIDDSPHKIAAGFALGVFFGIFPGEGVFSALVVSSLFHFNKISATAGVLATNMWTTLVVLPMAAFVGAGLFGRNYLILVSEFKSKFHMGLSMTDFFSKFIFFDLTLPILVGFFLTSALIALACYFILYFLIKYNKIKA